MIDNYNDSISGGAIFAGATGVAGLMIASRFANKWEKDLYDTSEHARGYYEKFNWSNPHERAGKTLMDRLSGVKGSKMPFREDFKMMKLWGEGRSRAPNSFEQSWRNTIRPNSKMPTKLYKAPMAYGFAMLSMKMEMDESDHFSGAIKGLVSEVGAVAGSRIGSAIGGALGGPLGAGIGMLAGGVLGYSTLGAIESASKIGRSWSIPELGGNYQDSAEAMTLRQRSLNSIRTSQFNVRSELGSEAMRLAGL